MDFKTEQRRIDAVVRKKNIVIAKLLYQSRIISEKSFKIIYYTTFNIFSSRFTTLPIIAGFPTIVFSRAVQSSLYKPSA